MGSSRQEYLVGVLGWSTWSTWLENLVLGTWSTLFLPSGVVGAPGGGFLPCHMVVGSVQAGADTTTAPTLVCEESEMIFGVNTGDTACTM